MRGVWRDVVGPEPMPVPPYSRDWGETGPVEVLAEAARAAMVELDVSDARTGDVILFRMRAGAILPSIAAFFRARTAVGVPTAAGGPAASSTPMNAPV